MFKFTIFKATPVQGGAINVLCGYSGPTCATHSAPSCATHFGRIVPYFGASCAITEVLPI